MSLLFSYSVQTHSAVQNAAEKLATASADLKSTYLGLRDNSYDLGVLHSHVGEAGNFNIIQTSGVIVTGGNKGKHLPKEELELVKANVDKGVFRATILGVDSYCRADILDNMEMLLVILPSSEVYDDRDADAYETALADIILLTVLYVLISMLAQSIVVNNLHLVNESLNKITNGHRTRPLR